MSDEMKELTEHEPVEGLRIPIVNGDLTRPPYPPGSTEGDSLGALVNRMFMHDSTEWIFDICGRIRAGESIYVEHT